MKHHEGFSSEPERIRTPRGNFSERGFEVPFAANGYYSYVDSKCLPRLLRGSFIDPELGVIRVCENTDGPVLHYTGDEGTTFVEAIQKEGEPGAQRQARGSAAHWKSCQSQQTLVKRDTRRRCLCCP